MIQKKKTSFDSFPLFTWFGAFAFEARALASLNLTGKLSGMLIFYFVPAKAGQ